MFIFFIYSQLSYFRILFLFSTLGKGIGQLYKINLSKLSTPISKKPGVLSSDLHTSSSSNSTITSISSRLDNKHITTNQIKNNISNTDYIQSCVTPQKQSYSVQETYTSTHLRPLNATLPIPYLKLHTTTKLPPAGEYYFCFQINSKYSQADKSIKYRIRIRVVDSIFSIDTFEHQSAVLKGKLRFPRLKDHMKKMGIDQSVRNRASFEHKCLNNIKRYISMLVSVITNKILDTFLRLLWFLLQKK